MNSEINRGPQRAFEHMLPAEVLSFLQEEEQALQVILSSLDEQIDRYSQRHAQENARSRELTAQLVAARRDTDKQMIASEEAVSYRLRDGWREELGNIVELKKNPYFARVIVEETEDAAGNVSATRRIEYRLGKHSNTDCRIVDWKKSPISKLFYEYREGEDYCEVIQGRERVGRVVSRSKLRIGDGRLEAVSCRFGDFIFKDGQWEEQAFSVVKRTTRTALPDVTALITADQFRAITQEADGAVFIKGVAGSGKTTVALHRLTWLVENGLVENGSVKNGLVEASVVGSGHHSKRAAGVVVQTKTLKSYVQNTLKALEHGDLEVVTFEEWLKKELAREFSSECAATLRIPSPYGAQGAPPSVERFKNSVAFLKRIDEYASEQKHRVIDFLARSPLSANASFIKLLDQAKAPNSGSLELLDNLEILVTSPQMKAGPQAQDAARLLSELPAMKKKLSLYHDELAILMSQADAIIRHDPTSLLDRETITNARKRYEANRAQGVLEFSDAALLLLLKQVKYGRATLRRTGYRYLMIDEVQDFSPIELALITNKVEHPSGLSLVGDLAQATSDEFAFPAWAALRKHWLDTREAASTVNLTVSQRSSAAIMRFAGHIRGDSERSHAPASESKPGKPPLCMLCPNESLGIRFVVGWLNKVLDHFPGSLTAVLCSSKEESRYVYGLLKPTFSEVVRLAEDVDSFEEGIVVADVRSVKGLEFSYVLLWNPSKRAYPGTDLARNLLYVAVTRAEELLNISLWGEPSPFFPPMSSRLWRVRDRRDEEEEES